MLRDYQEVPYSDLRQAGATGSMALCYCSVFMSKEESCLFSLEKETAGASSIIRNLLKRIKIDRCLTNLEAAQRSPLPPDCQSVLQTGPVALTIEKQNRVTRIPCLIRLQTSLRRPGLTWMPTTKEIRLRLQFYQRISNSRTTFLLGRKALRTINRLRKKLNSGRLKEAIIFGAPTGGHVWSNSERRNPRIICTLDSLAKLSRASWLSSSRALAALATALPQCIFLETATAACSAVPR